MFFLIAFTTLFQLFFISGGDVLFEMGFIKITSHGIEQAGIIFCRFACLERPLAISATPQHFSFSSR